MANVARAAGTNSFGKTGGTAKDCLKFDARPSTPPEIGKYRKSVTLAPGVRFQHHGTAADYAAKKLDELTFGECSDRGDNTAATLLSHHKVGTLESMNLLKAEKVYRSQAREPLGQTLDRGTVLPSKFTDGHKAFGIASNTAPQPAKDIIFPILDEETIRGEEIYKRSHGAFGPGEQTRRNYDWHGADMNKRVFGVKGNSLAFNGVSSDVAEALRGGNLADQSSSITRKEVEDFRNTGDILGKIKNLRQQDVNRSSDLAFGVPSGVVRTGGRPRLSAQEVMKGNYSEDDALPDRDLGTSITPGFRNTNCEDNRRFGCPSIRSDLPAQPRGRRSIADSQNYGDDVPAHDLINPPAHFSTNLSSSALDDLKEKESIQRLFIKIGYSLDQSVFNVIFDEAGSGSRECTVNEFQRVLNSYLSAVDTNKEYSWLRARGA